MKAILMSIQPKWCELIASGKKTVEVRKTAPKDTPFKVYIYCTRQKVNGEILLTYDKKIEGRNRGFRDNGDIPLAGKVIGDFVCDKVIKTCGWRLRGNTGWCAKRTEAEEKFPTSACLTIDKIVEYAGGEGREVSGWHISELKIYDEPKELSEFKKLCPIKNQDCAGCEFYSDYGGSCTNYVTHPPRGWQYVEE